MTPEAARRAASLLLAARHRRRPITRLPEDCAPPDLAGAYEIQMAFIGLAAPGQPAGAAIAGFKIGATSTAAQAYLGLDGPFYGAILHGGILSSPARVSLSEHNFCLIESEFAVRLGRDLPDGRRGYTRDEVAGAVASVHPAFEVVTSAYGEAWREAGAAHLIADNGVHACLVLGAGERDWRGMDLASHPVVFRRNGREEGRGAGANALGHPLDALAWLAGQEAAGGRGLKAGDVVTTGVVTPFIYAEAGDELVADFGRLGQVRLDITP